MKKRVPAATVLLVAALLLCACAAPAPVPSLSPVTDTGAVYSHEKSGFTITYPADWTVLSDTDISSLYAQISDQIKSMYKNPAEYEAALEKNIPVSCAFLHPRDAAVDFNANINIVIMTVPAAQSKDIVGMAKQVAKEMESAVAAGTITTGEASAAKVGGLDAAVQPLTMKTQDVEVSEKQYYVAHNGYVAIITLSALDSAPADLDTLQKAVDNVRFK